MKVVQFLDATWGEWGYVPALNQLRFKEPAAAEAYQSRLTEFNEATETALNLKAAIVSTNNRKPAETRLFQ